jgi:hypothetical protein
MDRPKAKSRRRVHGEAYREQHALLCPRGSAGSCQPIARQFGPLLRISQTLDATPGIQTSLWAWFAELVVEDDVEKGAMNLQCIANAVINKP